MMTGILRILRQTETVRLLHIDLELVALVDALAEEGRGDAEPLALADDVAHGIDRQRQLSGRRTWATTRSSRAAAAAAPAPRRRLPDAAACPKTSAAPPSRRALRHRRRDPRPAPAPVAFSRCAPPVMKDEQLEQLIGRRRQEKRSSTQRLAQRLVGDLGVWAAPEQRDDLVDEAEVVAREHAKAVAHVVSRACCRRDRTRRDRSPSPSPRLVEQAPRQEGRQPDFRGHGRARPSPPARPAHSRPLAAPCRRLRAGALSISSNSSLSIRAVSLPPGAQRLRRFFAPVAIESRVVGADCSRTGRSQLRHRGHHAAAERTSLGELHAVGDRPSPGRARGPRRRSPSPCGASMTRLSMRSQRRRAVEAEHAGEKPVEPGRWPR